MILPHHDKFPEIHPSAFVAPSADVIGEVKIGAESSLWFQVVVRGDVNTIAIGERTNIQDQSVLHVTRVRAPLRVGSDVTVGHRVILHGCTIGDRVLVGMGSVIMDRAFVPNDCVIGAGSLITEGKVFQSGTLIMGSPAREIRKLKAEELEFLKKSAANYVEDAKGYLQLMNERKGSQ